MKVALFVLLIVAIIGGGIFAVKMRQLPDGATPASIQLAFADELEILRAIATDSVGADPQNPVAVQELDLDEMIERAQAIENPVLLGVNLKQSYAPRSNRLVVHLIGTRETLGGWTMPKDRPVLGQPHAKRVVNAHGTIIRYEEVVLETAEFDVRLVLTLDLETLDE